MSQTKLLLPAPDAAQALSVCDKTLWSWAKPRGPIPCVRTGRRVLYDVRDLLAFIERQKGGEQ